MKPWAALCESAKRLLVLTLSSEVGGSYVQDILELTCPLVLYAIGIVELELESTSGLVLLLFVIPLAFTLSGFLLWIMYALNGKSSGAFPSDIITLTCRSNHNGAKG